MAYFMDEMTVKDMNEVTSKTTTIILPVGVVEQHGFHLPLSTDFHNANEIPIRAGERLNAVVAPTVPYCYSGGDLKGTINVSPQVFSLLIMDICLEFVRNGFKDIIILLGHGGTDNRIALNNCLQMIMKRMPEDSDVTFSLVEVFILSATWQKYFRMEPQHDFHAGLVETSLMMYWKPELVREKIEMDDPDISELMRTDQDWFELSEKPFDHEFVIPRKYQRKEIKVGVMGFPEQASVEIGEKICGEIVDGLVEYVDKLNGRRQ